MKTEAGLIALFVAVTAVMLFIVPYDNKMRLKEEFGVLAKAAETDERAEYIIENIEQYPKELLNIYYSRSTEDNLDFVYNYPFNPYDWRSVAYTQEELNGEGVPALYMRDPRWAYAPCSGEFIKTQGCASVALTMAYLRLRHDGSVTPPIVANFADNNDCNGMMGGILTKKLPVVFDYFGFDYVEHIFDEEGCAPLTEQELREAASRPDTVVYAALSGETFGGHAVIIRGCDETGFYINDPANPENTEKVWDFEVFENELTRFYELS